jgi:hypothetical protein
MGVVQEPTDTDNTAGSPGSFAVRALTTIANARQALRTTCSYTL